MQEAGSLTTELGVADGVSERLAHLADLVVVC